jgi:hypothetical protein
MLLAEAAAVVPTAQSSSVALNVGVRRYDAAIKASRFADTQIKGMVKCMEVVTHHRAAHLFRRRSGCERGKLHLRLQLQVGLRVVLCSKQVLLHGFQPISPLDFDMLHHAVVRFKL